MEKVFFLPVEQLKGNNENPFPSLSDREYKDLKESILKYGIMEPLIVYPHNGSSYEVISGNHRLRIAKEIGMKNVPCSIIDISKIEGALDTEVFRRHLSSQDREKYIKLKQESSKARLEKELSRSLIQEIYQIYKAGKLSQDDAIYLAAAGIDKQKSIFSSFLVESQMVKKDQEEKEEMPKDSEEISKLKGEVERLKNQLKNRENELSELKRWKEEHKAAIQKKIEELQKSKGRVTEKETKKYEQQVKDLEETNEKLRRIIREKEKEIDKITEAKNRIEEALRRKEEEKKTQKTAEDIELLEKKRSFYEGVIMNSLDSLDRTINELECAEVGLLLKRQLANIRRKLQNVIHHLEKYDQKLASLEA